MNFTLIHNELSKPLLNIEYLNNKSIFVCEQHFKSMKKTLILVMLLISTAVAFSQQNFVTINK